MTFKDNVKIQTGSQLDIGDITILSNIIRADSSITLEQDNTSGTIDISSSNTMNITSYKKLNIESETSIDISSANTMNITSYKNLNIESRQSIDISSAIVKLTNLDISGNLTNSQNYSMNAQIKESGDSWFVVMYNPHTKQLKFGIPPYT